MKFVLLILAISSAFAAASKKPSHSPVAPNKEEREEIRMRAGSMGGAPNAGAGMGTGTGAGSTVGNHLGKGSITAGSESGANGNGVDSESAP